MKNQTTHNSSTIRGFTIIELMIATTILAVILLVVTAMAVNIGNLFYKDVNQASIQDNVRAITDELTQHLQLMSTTGLQQIAPTATTAGAICIDSTRYSYVIGKQISPNPANPPGDQTVHVLWRDTWTGGGCPPVTNLTTAASPSSSGTELIAPNSRLTALCIGSYTPSTNTCTPPAAGSTTFTVTVGGAYGDGDLLSTTTGTTAQCKGQVGDRFCATAYLSTTVDQRLVTGATPPGGGGSSCSLPASLAATAPSYQDNVWPMDYVAGTGADSPFYTTTPELAKGDAGDHGPLHNSTGSSPNKVVAFTAAFCSDYHASLTGASCIVDFNYGDDIPGGIVGPGVNLIDASGTVQPIPGAPAPGPGVPASYYCVGAGAPTNQIFVSVSSLVPGTYRMQFVGAFAINGAPPNQPYLPYDDTSYPMYHPNYVKFQVNP